MNGDDMKAILRRFSMNQGDGEDVPVLSITPYSAPGMFAALCKAVAPDFQDDVMTDAEREALRAYVAQWDRQ